MKRALLVLAALQAPAALAAFKCVDERGVTHIGDTPPAGCATVVMYEVNRLGNVVRRIDPTPTPEQLKLKLAEDEKRREADKAAAEQRRKDLALINTFSGEREFDVARDRNIEPIRGRIASAQERLKAIDARSAKIDEEMEFYKAGKSKAAKKGRETDAPPPMLVHEQERLAKEKVGLLASISSYEKEIDQIRGKFDVDKQRWLAIKSGAVPMPKGPAPDAKSTAKTSY